MNRDDIIKLATVLYSIDSHLELCNSWNCTGCPYEEYKDNSFCHYIEVAERLSTEYRIVPADALVTTKQEQTSRDYDIYNLGLGVGKQEVKNNDAIDAKTVANNLKRLWNARLTEQEQIEELQEIVKQAGKILYLAQDGSCIGQKPLPFKQVERIAKAVYSGRYQKDSAIAQEMLAAMRTNIANHEGEPDYTPMKLFNIMQDYANARFGIERIDINED